MSKKLLILDIDETLLHSTYEDLGRAPELNYKIRNVYLRPHLKEFMEFAFAHFDVAIWTASKEEYAHLLLEQLGYKDQMTFIYSRNKCIEREVDTGIVTATHWVKDLTKIEDYNLEDIVFIDDTPLYIHPIENAVLIPEFRGDLEDTELLKMMDRLRKWNEGEGI